MKTKRFFRGFMQITLSIAFVVFGPTALWAADHGGMSGNHMMMDKPMHGQRMMQKPMAERRDAPIYIGPVALYRIQNALNQRGFDSGPADGMWGKKTASAIKQFQKSQSIAASGKLDIKTIQELGFSEILKGNLDQIASLDWNMDKIRGPGAPLYLSSAHLKQVQQSLQNRGFEVGKVDGIWGDQTRQALQSFEEYNNIGKSGLVTLSALDQLGVTSVVGNLQLPPDETKGYAQNTDEYAEQLKEAGMNVKTSAPPENTKDYAQNTDEYAEQLREAGMNVKTSAEDRGRQYARTEDLPIDTQRRNMMMEEAGMDVKTAPVEEGQMKGQIAKNDMMSGRSETRAYYGASQSKRMAGGNFAPLFAGSDVIAQVQTALVDSGFYPGNTDGIWSDTTSLAIGQFQRSKNLAVTGTLTVATLNKLIGKSLELGGK